MNAITATHASALSIPEDEAIRVLGNSLYPGAKPESIRMVLAWCRATGRDPMKRPIHIVPMYIEDKTTGKSEMRDVLMPGIGAYRSDAAATGQYAGKSEPEYGPEVTGKIGNVQLTYPRWCKVTVYRLVSGHVRGFAAKELWLENYATASRHSADPNYMWKKRPFAQLAKVAEAQALRMAFPDETGGAVTAEEMEGKDFVGPTIEGDAVKGQTQTLRDRINDTVPFTKPAEPPRRTSRQWLEELRGVVAHCQTTAELDAIATSEEVRKAQQYFRDGALEELNGIFADAMGRLAEAEEDAGEDGAADDDSFPGDRPPETGHD